MKRFGLTEATLDAYLDGRLNAAEAERIDEMLDNDPRFQRYVDHYIELSLTAVVSAKRIGSEAGTQGVDSIGKVIRLIKERERSLFECPAEELCCCDTAAESDVEYGSKILCDKKVADKGEIVKKKSYLCSRKNKKNNNSNEQD